MNVPPELKQMFSQVRESVSKMPEADRLRVEDIANSIRAAMAHGDHHAVLAFALVGAEVVTR